MAMTNTTTGAGLTTTADAFTPRIWAGWSILPLRRSRLLPGRQRSSAPTRTR